MLFCYHEETTQPALRSLSQSHSNAYFSFFAAIVLSSIALMRSSATHRNFRSDQSYETKYLFDTCRSEEIIDEDDSALTILPLNHRNGEGDFVFLLSQ